MEALVYGLIDFTFTIYIIIWYYSSIYIHGFMTFFGFGLGLPLKCCACEVWWLGCLLQGVHGAPIRRGLALGDAWELQVWHSSRVYIGHWWNLNQSSKSKVTRPCVLRKPSISTLSVALSDGASRSGWFWHGLVVHEKNIMSNVKFKYKFKKQKTPLRKGSKEE